MIIKMEIVIRRKIMKRNLKRFAIKTLAFIIAAAQIGISPAIASATGSKSIVVKYDDFATNSENLQINNHASIIEKILRLTPSMAGRAGSVFTKERILLDNSKSFSTYFAFEISQPGGPWANGRGADGFTFTIQTESNTAGTGGSGLGFQGINPGLAIEFDTFGGGSDISDNHIGIDINGNIESIAQKHSPFELTGGETLHTWIDYNGEADMLEIRLSDSNKRPDEVFLSKEIDLENILDMNEVFAGFTAGTGGNYQNHDILKWYFESKYDPIDTENGSYDTIEISGIQEGGAYRETIIDFSGGSAKLNGNTIQSGTSVNEEGDYIFELYDEDGDKREIHFNIDKTSPAKPSVKKTLTPNGQVVVFVQADETGVKFEYKTDDAEWQECSNQITLYKNCKLQFRVVDKAENLSENVGLEIDEIEDITDSVDFNINPNSPFSNYQYNVNIQKPASYTVRGEVYDSVSASVYYNMSGAQAIEWTEYKEAFAVTEDGTTEITAKLVHEDGSKVSEKKTSVTLDKTPSSLPVISKTPDAEGTNKKYTISIRPGEDGLSGVKETRYSLSGAVERPWTLYEGPFEVQGTGRTTIQAYTEDRAGNRAYSGSIVITVDKHAPQKALIELSPQQAENEGPYTVSIQAGSDDIGVKEVQYRLKDEAGQVYSDWKTYTGAFDIKKYNKTVIEAKTVDIAGNESEISAEEVSINPLKPYISTSPDEEAFMGEYVVSMEAGIKNIDGQQLQYRLKDDGGNVYRDWTVYEGSFKVEKYNDTIIECKTVDSFGNESPSDSKRVYVIRKSSKKKSSSKDEKVEVKTYFDKDEIKTSWDKDLDGDMLKGGKAKISLKFTTDEKVLISSSILRKLNKKDEELVIERNGLGIVYPHGSIDVDSKDSSLEFEMSKVSKYKLKNSINSLKKVKGIGADIYNVGVSVDKRSIKKYEKPVKIEFDMSGLEFKDANKLTGVVYELDENGKIEIVKLGGIYDKASKSFTCYTDRPGLLSVGESDGVLEIDLKLGEKKMSVNHEVKENEAAPKIINNRTMVPVRFVAETLGSEVEWDSDTRTVTIRYEGEKFDMVIDETIKGFDTPAVIENGRTMVPIRYVAEKFGANILWFEDSKSVKIVK